MMLLDGAGSSHMRDRPRPTLQCPTNCAILAECRDHHWEQPMLRFTIAILVAIVASETAESADRALTRQGPHHGWRRVAARLPAGLPRPHYNFRTTISYGAPYPYPPPSAPPPLPHDPPDQPYPPHYPHAT